MAKKASTVPAVRTNSTAVGKTADAPPAALASLAKKDAGKGVSTAQEDNLIPLIYVLQAQSPQVNKRNAGSYIAGAEAGSIWLRNFSDPIVAGEEGFLFQPCHFSKDWVEWIPRDNGGGFVGRHAELPKDAKKVSDPKNPSKVRYVRKNGNEIIETRYHVGNVITAKYGAVPYVIPLTSSGHTVSRDWMFRMNSKQLPTGDKAPSWMCLYRLRTKERTNAAGTWFTWDISDEGWVQSEEDYLRGASLHEAVTSGAKAVEADTFSETEESSDKL